MLFVPALNGDASCALEVAAVFVKPVKGLKYIDEIADASKSADESVDLFRHVSPEELADLEKNGFRPGAGSLDGKWFAESGEHATEWGSNLNKGRGTVVTVRVPAAFANRLMRLEKLDGIGPARYVEPDGLGELNLHEWRLW